MKQIATLQPLLGNQSALLRPAGDSWLIARSDDSTATAACGRPMNANGLAGAESVAGKSERPGNERDA